MASIDDVHSLLNAVNTVTLKRMEDKTDAINAVTLKRMEDKTDAITNTTLKRMEEKADRATGVERDFQIQVRAKLGDIDEKVQRITMAMFTPSPTPSPSPTPPPGGPTVDELSSDEAARERARLVRKAAAAAAAAVGVTFPPGPSEKKTGVDQLSCAELCGAAVAAHDLYMIAIAEGLGGGYAAYYHGLADAYGTAAVAACSDAATMHETTETTTDLASEELARKRAERAKKAAAAVTAALGVTFPETYETKTGVDQLSCSDLLGASAAAGQMELIAVAEGLGGGYAAYYHGLSEAYLQVAEAQGCLAL